ncbi:MAG TPA: hypothetical protein VE979_08800, partial [Streptosporangiaceae bacterium]|nr:hypothetical protein [Streptosporangiaceae bacterium]
CLARENVQVIDEQLAALGSERCIEVMGHETLRSSVLLVTSRRGTARLHTARGRDSLRLRGLASADVVHSELGAAGAGSVR